jgi:hypothetical protein
MFTLGADIREAPTVRTGRGLLFSYFPILVPRYRPPAPGTFLHGLFQHPLSHRPGALLPPARIFPSCLGPGLIDKGAP